jgi:hypothetical protein
VNLDLKESKGGKHYFQLDTWEPNPKMAAATPKVAAKVTVAPADTDEIPF